MAIEIIKDSNSTSDKRLCINYDLIYVNQHWSLYLFLLTLGTDFIEAECSQLRYQTC